MDNQIVGIIYTIIVYSSINIIKFVWNKFSNTVSAMAKVYLLLMALRKKVLLCFQIQAANGDVTITNDGATILKQMQVLHPAAKMVKSL